MTTQIDLREVSRQDLKYFISLHTADQERTRKMIQRFEADIPDIEMTLPKYTPTPKENVNPLKVLTMFLP